MRLWSLSDGTDGKCIAVLQSKMELVNSCAFSPDGNMLAVCGGQKHTLCLYTGKDLRFVTTFLGHIAEVSSCKFNSRGDILVSASFDNTLRLWEMATHRCIMTLEVMFNMFDNHLTFIRVIQIEFMNVYSAPIIN